MEGGEGDGGEGERPRLRAEIEKDQAAATYVYGGKIYYFCAPGCKRQFEKEPNKYLKD